MPPETRYFTVKGYGETEIHIQRSRFIAYVDRAETEQAAMQFVESIQKKHWNATHNCYAFVVKEEVEIQRSSDDGEPAGTAGRPILEVIKSRELINTVVVVTRYFGGIKLGAGGLVRAYSQSASAGIQAAKEVECLLHRAVTLIIDYPAVGKVEHELRSFNFVLESPEFTDKVSWKIWVPVGQEELLVEKVAEWTSGQGRVKLGETKYVEKEKRPHR
ncbi:YigZ family protein [Marinithermofilum abyssi]|uniref:YigZ family protein n=1 Tax=Marinithermofilum abyssi TaxID=1571185 RepID=A0A8J2VFS2_9BACL|nr:YigZ family protein [Marinithermofilum abyssi]GGE04915.1 YigZ family protein [Marinithermofilum abyssi]